MNRGIILAVLLAAPVCVAVAQQACPSVVEGPLTPAKGAYAHGNYADAEEFYRGEVAAHPDDQKAAAGLVQSLLHEGKSGEAAERVAKMVAADPNSAVALTAKAEVELREGQPWLTLETLAAAEKADPCYARIHFVRSRVLRLDSQYATERAEVEAANRIDPKDPDIHRAWLGSVQPAKEIVSIHEALSTMKEIDADTKQKALKSISDMMLLLSENNQTCQMVPALEGAITLPLAASYEDARRIGSYKLEVQLAQTKAHLTVDTAASGLFISRALADLNGLTPALGAPAGTVHADSVKIGPLEFKDCTVGVSETPFADKADGFIGTDVFAPWLIHLDQPGAKLTLSQLPAAAGILPANRPAGSSVPAALQGFSPVYQRRQYLLVPVTLNNKLRRLFALDSGLRVSMMTPEAAHAVSSTKINFTNRAQTKGGATIEVYRDSFDFQFASLSLPQQSHIVEFDPSTIERNTGIQVAGLLGFDMLHSLDMQIDYRDGLVKFESGKAGAGSSNPHDNPAAVAIAAAPSCNPEGNESQPLTTTIQATVVGFIDSAHLKAGSNLTLKMATSWENGTCELARGSPLYGHVIEARSEKSPNSSELALVFDAGECFDNGKIAKRNLPLKIIGLIGPPDQFVGIQSAMPVQVAGGGRDIKETSVAIGSGSSQFSNNLNPDGPPNTIKHGIVKGLPGVKLEPQGGPGCSAKITSTGRSVRFGDGSQFILTMMSPSVEQ